MPKIVKIYAGSVINGWLIEKDLGIINGRRFVSAICKCDNKKTIAYTKIFSGITKSCGCESSKYFEIRNLGKLDQQKIKEILNYDPDAGTFTWKKRPSTKINAGSIAGCKNPDGYIVIAIDKKQYQAANLAWLYMTGEWPFLQIDHINRVRDDNRFCNLREATLTEQQYNQGICSSNTSGHKWVRHDKQRNQWMVRSKLFGYIGRYKTKEEAIKVAEKQKEKMDNILFQK